MKFTVGMRVRLSARGREIHCNSMSNPHNEIGVVTHVPTSERHFLLVNWKNFTGNYYIGTELKAATLGPRKLEDYL